MGNPVVVVSGSSILGLLVMWIYLARIYGEVRAIRREMELNRLESERREKAQ